MQLLYKTDIYNIDKTYFSFFCTLLYLGNGILAFSGLSTNTQKYEKTINWSLSKVCIYGGVYVRSQLSFASFKSPEF